MSLLTLNMTLGTEYIGMGAKGGSGGPKQQLQPAILMGPCAQGKLGTGSRGPCARGRLGLAALLLLVSFFFLEVLGCLSFSFGVSLSCMVALVFIPKDT